MNNYNKIAILDQGEETKLNGASPPSGGGNSAGDNGGSHEPENEIKSKDVSTKVEQAKTVGFAASQVDHLTTQQKAKADSLPGQIYDKRSRAKILREEGEAIVDHCGKDDPRNETGKKLNAAIITGAFLGLAVVAFSGFFSCMFIYRDNVFGELDYLRASAMAAIIPFTSYFFKWGLSLFGDHKEAALKLAYSVGGVSILVMLGTIAFNYGYVLVEESARQSFDTLNTQGEGKKNIGVLLFSLFLSEISFGLFCATIIENRLRPSEFLKRKWAEKDAQDKIAKARDLELSAQQDDEELKRLIEQEKKSEKWDKFLEKLHEDCLES